MALFGLLELFATSVRPTIRFLSVKYLWGCSYGKAFSS